MTILEPKTLQRLRRVTLIGTAGCLVVFAALTFSSLFGSYGLAGETLDKPDDPRIDRQLTSYEDRVALGKIFLYASIACGSATFLLYFAEEKAKKQ